MRLALFQPDIPQNTGAMIRICACFDVGLDIIHPTGYIFNKKNIKQAALDYVESVSLIEHDSWELFLENNKNKRIILLSTKGKVSYTNFDFKKDEFLLIGIVITSCTLLNTLSGTPALSRPTSKKSSFLKSKLV